MKKLPLLLAAAAIGSMAAMAEKPSLKISSGNRDTVYASTQVVVGVTSPGATATVNGVSAKVYKTGSFGAEVPLQLGNNTVVVASTLNGETTETKFNIFRAEKPAKEAAPSMPVADQIYATPFYVSTKQGAYLQYGNADDRLGGSKMGFLAPGILLKVVGKSDDLYKVQLSSTRYAYLPIEHAELSQEVAPEAVCTSSWSITNQGKSDRVAVSLPVKRPYSYHTELEPSSIIVEVYGAIDNSNWITQRTMNLGIIDYVTFNQKESDVYEIIIRLKEKYQWGFTVDYDGSALIVNVRHCPADLSLKALTIGLDAGHGGKYSGAISPSGIKEKDVNLDIVMRLRDLLEKKGAKVVLTRTDDSGPTMAERKQTWHDGAVDIAISVHNNAGGSALSAPGTSTYYKHLFDRPLSEMVLNRLLETGLNLYGLTGNFNFSLNGPTEYPNTLVEGMFMSSLEEEEKVADPAFRQLVAEKIFLGLQDYLKEVERSRKK